MSDLYEQYGLEMEDEGIPADTLPESDNKPIVKKKGGWLRSIIALVLGIVIGVGGIVGGGYFALSQPAGSTLQMVGGFAGLDYESQIKNKFLAEEYEDKSLLQVGMELFKVATEKNLSGISNVVPVVGEYIDKLVNNMNSEFGVVMDSEKLLTTEFSQLPAYLGEVFRTTPLGNMLKATSKVDKLEPILMEVCYGEEGVHYHLDENGEVVMNEGYEAATFETFGTNPNSMINKISLAAVLPPKADDTLMLSMAYGRKDVTFVLEENEDGTVKLDEDGHPIVTMLPLFFEEEDGTFYDYNGDPVNCTVTTLDGGFIEMVKAPTFDGSGEQTYYLKQGADGKYYAYKEPTDTAEPATFKKTMIGDLSENSSAMINNIYLKDALKVEYGEDPANDPHKILFSLAYGTEGVDYKVDPVTREITMIGDAQPRTIGDLRDRGNDIINDVAISDIMTAEHDDALSMYLLYGKNGIHYELDESDNVVMLQKYIAISDDGTRVYNEYGELLLEKTELNPGYVLDGTTFTDINGIAYTCELSTPEKTIKTNDGNVEKVYYLFLDGEEAMFTNHSLGELSGGDNLISRLTDRLTLTEVLHDENLAHNKFLKHVSDCPVNEIPKQILEVSITEMFREDIYEGDFLQHTGDEPIQATDGTLIYKGEYYKVIGTEIHVYNPTAADLKPTWWYLLNDPTGVKSPDDYKAATDMNALLTNMTTNVENSTLYNLKEDKIIGGLTDDLVNADIKREIKVDGVNVPLDLTPLGIPASAATLGDLTVTQMLAYTTAVLALI